MNASVVDFCLQVIDPSMIREREVLEVGSRNVNGTVQEEVKKMRPGKYTGIDIIEGPGVDEVMHAGQIVEKLGKERFDFILTTECMEHVDDWKSAVTNMKNALKPGGYLLVTTRSKGFGYHAWPYDYWRYEISDMEQIFSDLRIISLQKDPQFPGVFMLAQKPATFTENNLSEYRLYSIVKWKRLPGITQDQVTDWDVRRNLFLYHPFIAKLAKIAPSGLKKWYRKLVLKH